MSTPPKKRKIDAECRLFNKSWTPKYLFVEAKGKALCLDCGVQLSVFKDYNLSRHYRTMHAEKYRNLSEAERERTAQALLAKLLIQHHGPQPKPQTPRDGAVKTSFIISHKIAKNSKPFSDGQFIKECLVESAEIMCPEKKDVFDRVPLSRRTVTRRVEGIAGNLELQLRIKADRFEYFSLALYESCDVGDVAHLLVFVRGITNMFEITEELAAVRPLKGTRTGISLLAEVATSLEKLGLTWDKLVAVTTDGSPHLAGESVGFLQRLQEKVSESNSDVRLLFLHCFIHQEVLCKTVLRINHVIDVVTKVVNFIRGRTLNHKQFVELLEEHGTEHGDIGHTAVRRLSMGKVLKIVWDLRTQIQDFCESKGKAIPELSDKDWIADLAFAVDVTALLNELNAKLQGKGLFAHEIYSQVKAFMRKLQFLSSQLDANILTHMPTLSQVAPTPEHLCRCSAMLGALHGEFARRFIDFKTIEEEMKMVSSPFTFGVEDAPSDVQFELIELQSDTILVELFKSAFLQDFYASLKEQNFPQMRRHAQRMLVLFGSTYICEQTFSVMQFNKSRYRSSLSDDHLSAVLRISTSNIQPDFSTLVKAQQKQEASQ